jgi:hypothetical protein
MSASLSGTSKAKMFSQCGHTQAASTIRKYSPFLKIRCAGKISLEPEVSVLAVVSADVANSTSACSVISFPHSGQKIFSKNLPKICYGYWHLKFCVYPEIAR